MESEEEVRSMITDKGGDICEECVLICMEILIKNQREYKEIDFKTGQNNSSVKRLSNE